MDSLALAHEDDDINIVDAFIEWTSRLDPYDDEDVEFPSWVSIAHLCDIFIVRANVVRSILKLAQS